MNVKKAIVTGIFASAFLFPPAVLPAAADDITDEIGRGLKQYEQGRYTEASQALDTASQMIRQKRGEQLKGILPEPLEGWTADEPDFQSAGAALLGGGITVERVYHRGEGSVTVTVVAESPMVQAMAVLFTNPMLAASGEGKIEKIKGRTALVKYDREGRSGSVQILVDNRMLITAEGDGVDLEDLKRYAGAVKEENPS